MPVESAELALLPASICNPNHKDAPKLNSLPQSLINAQEAKDMRVDAQLRAACGGDATQLCADAAQSGVEGAVYDCLVRPGARPGDLFFFFFGGQPLSWPGAAAACPRREWQRAGCALRHTCPAGGLARRCDAAVC